MAGTTHDDLNELLETTWAGGLRALGRTERRFEAAVTAVVVAIAVGLALYTPEAPSLLLLPLVLAYAVASRIAYPLGAGYAIPTQLVLVPALAVAPIAVIPLFVVSGLALGTLGDTLRRRSRLERICFAGGDAAHAIAPVLLLLIYGAGTAMDAPLWLLASALALQLVSDLVASSVREWVSTGVRPRVQLAVIAQVWAVDLALTPVGAFAVMSVDEYPWAPLGLLLLLALFGYSARDRGVLIERAHERLQQLQRERERLRVAVRRIGEAFASKLDLDALLQIVTSAAAEALDAAGGRGSTTLGAGRPLCRRASISEDPTVASLLSRAESRAIELDGVVTDEGNGWYAAAASIPSDGWPAGAVSLVRRQPFDKEEQQLLAYLCEQAAVAAGNVIQMETLHRLALTDELTGLANHRRFQEILDAAVDRQRLTGRPLALLLLDIDDFKQLNDTYGHQLGDTVLAAVGRRLREESRASDEPARYGGEEFAVVLEDADLHTANTVAERLRGGVMALPLVAPSGDPLEVTVSVGVAAIGIGIATKSELIDAADTSLYCAKADGKNQVTVFAGEAAIPRRFVLRA